MGRWIKVWGAVGYIDRIIRKFVSFWESILWAYLERLQRVWRIAAASLRSWCDQCLALKADAHWAIDREGFEEDVSALICVGSPFYDLHLDLVA